MFWSKIIPLQPEFMIQIINSNSAWSPWHLNQRLRHSLININFLSQADAPIKSWIDNQRKMAFIAITTAMAEVVKPNNFSEGVKLMLIIKKKGAWTITTSLDINFRNEY